MYYAAYDISIKFFKLLLSILKDYEILEELIEKSDKRSIVKGIGSRDNYFYKYFYTFFKPFDYMTPNGSYLFIK